MLEFASEIFTTIISNVLLARTGMKHYSHSYYKKAMQAQGKIFGEKAAIRNIWPYYVHTPSKKEELQLSHAQHVTFYNILKATFFMVSKFTFIIRYIYLMFD